MQHHPTLPNEAGLKMKHSHWGVEPANMVLRSSWPIGGNQKYINIYVNDNALIRFLIRLLSLVPLSCLARYLLRGDFWVCHFLVFNQNAFLKYGSLACCSGWNAMQYGNESI